MATKIFPAQVLLMKMNGKVALNISTAKWIKNVIKVRFINLSKYFGFLLSLNGLSIYCLFDFSQ